MTKKIKLNFYPAQLLGILIGLFLSFGLAGQSVLAITPTITITPPASELTEVPAEQAEAVNENLKKIIDKVVEENKEAVDAKILGAKQRRRGLVGEVKSVREDTLTIVTTKGTQIIATDKTVKLIKAGKIIASSDISVGDWVSVIGEIKDDDFKASAIIVSAKTLETVKPVIMLGTIKTFAKQILTINNRANSEDKTFTAIKTSIWQDDQAVKASPTLFKESLQVFLVGIETETGSSIHTVRALAPFTKPTLPAR